MRFIVAMAIDKYLFIPRLVTNNIHKRAPPILDIPFYNGSRYLVDSSTHITIETIKHHGLPVGLEVCENKSIGYVVEA